MYLGLGESLSTIYCIKYIIFLFLFILNQKLKKKTSTLLNPTSPLLIKIFLLAWNWKTLYTFQCNPKQYVDKYLLWAESYTDTS